MHDLVLDSHSMTYNNSEDKITILNCNSCKRDLQKAKMPYLVLANHLYQGHLPDYLSDITWVEEMVCALYRTNTVVACVFASDVGVCAVLGSV